MNPINAHCIWLGPKKMRFSEEIMLMSVAHVYNIKPKLWVYNVDVQNSIIDTAEVIDIPKYLTDMVDILKDPISCRTDYIRLKILLDHGGLYLDMDGVCNKPIFDLIGHEDMIVGKCCNYDHNTYNNAVIYVKTPNNLHMQSLVNICTETIKKYNYNAPWGYLGPNMLTYYIRQKEYPSDIKLVSQEKFYKYTWEEGEWQKWFSSYTTDEIDEIYYAHIWGKVAKTLDAIDRDYILTKDNLYTAIARKTLLR